MTKILFQLTPEIIDMIIFGMENQSDEYYVDIKTGDVLSETQAEEEYEDEYIDSFIMPVPDWLPTDGFQLMESFVAALHNPAYKEDLRKILSIGKGAFRNFKNTVKKHESLTQQWYLHKEKVMRSRVIDWYNLNSEILKYNEIDENTDETENLILSDFIFNTNSSKWKELINDKSEESIHESLGEQDGDIAEYLICKNNSLLALPGNIDVSICAETLDGEFAGCIKGGIIKAGDNESILAVANVIWVEKKFRGMGLARHLIDKFTQNAENKKCEKIIFELTGMGSILNSSLEARGASTFFTTIAVKIDNM
ncbi:MAG: GNAT family N-acetyltransferase [Spirochaetales bacterium]|nr:GNAT family N-acetyltransferase [Spirochaetales bacterium]